MILDKIFEVKGHKYRKSTGIGPEKVKYAEICALA